MSLNYQKVNLAAAIPAEACKPLESRCTKLVKKDILTYEPGKYARDRKSHYALKKKSTNEVFMQILAIDTSNENQTTT